MDIRTLELFQKIAGGETFHAVADEYNLSLSTVSKAIRGLEDELGTDLFIREHRTVTLTKAGLYFYTNIGDVLAKYRSIMDHMRGFNSANHLTGIITCSDTAFPIDNICQQFMAQHPDCFINIEKVNDYNDAFKEVRAKHADFIIAHLPSESFDISVEKIILKKDPLLAIVSPEHHLSRHHDLSLSDLNYETIITNNYSNYFTKLLFGEHGSELINILNLRNYGRSKIIEYVEHNYGVALLFESDLNGRSTRNLKLIPMAQTMPLPLSLFYQKNNRSLILASFARFIKNYRS